MQPKYSLHANVNNPFLYKKMERILQKYDINVKEEEEKNSAISIVLSGNEHYEVFCFGKDKENLWGEELFPKNLYEVSPFLFLYMLRTKEYPLEAFREIKDFFSDEFQAITDGYTEIHIDFDSIEPVINKKEEEGFEKKHKSLYFKNGKLLFSVYSNIQIEKTPTPAKVIFDKEKEESRVEEDTKLYKKALAAFNIEDE